MGSDYVFVVFLRRSVWVRVGVGVVVVVALTLPEELPCFFPVCAGGCSDLDLRGTVFLVNTPGAEAVVGGELFLFDTSLQGNIILLTPP